MSRRKVAQALALIDEHSTWHENQPADLFPHYCRKDSVEILRPLCIEAL